MTLARYTFLLFKVLPLLKYYYFFLLSSYSPWNSLLPRASDMGLGKRKKSEILACFLLGGLGLGHGVSGQRPPWTCNLNSTNPHFLSSSSEDLFLHECGLRNPVDHKNEKNVITLSLTQSVLCCCWSPISWVSGRLDAAVQPGIHLSPTSNRKPLK